MAAAAEGAVHGDVARTGIEERQRLGGVVERLRVGRLERAQRRAPERLLARLTRLRDERHQLPAMRRFGPEFDLRVDARRAGAFDKTRRVVAQGFIRAGVNQHRRQTVLQARQAVGDGEVRPIAFR